MRYKQLVFNSLFIAVFVIACVKGSDGEKGIQDEKVIRNLTLVPINYNQFENNCSCFNEDELYIECPCNKGIIEFTNTINKTVSIDLTNNADFSTILFEVNNKKDSNCSIHINGESYEGNEIPNELNITLPVSLQANADGIACSWTMGFSTQNYTDQLNSTEYETELTTYEIEKNEKIEGNEKDENIFSSIIGFNKFLYKQNGSINMDVIEDIITTRFNGFIQEKVLNISNISSRDINISKLEEPEEIKCRENCDFYRILINLNLDENKNDGFANSTINEISNFIRTGSLNVNSDGFDCMACDDEGAQYSKSLKYIGRSLVVFSTFVVLIGFFALIKSRYNVIRKKRIYNQNRKSLTTEISFNSPWNNDTNYSAWKFDLAEDENPTRGRNNQTGDFEYELGQDNNGYGIIGSFVMDDEEEIFSRAKHMSQQNPRPDPSKDRFQFTKSETLNAAPHSGLEK